MSVMCRMLNVTRSGYYAWRDRPASTRTQRRDELVERIRQVHDESRGTYGSPRIAVELKDQGLHVCENTVAR